MNWEYGVKACVLRKRIMFSYKRLDQWFPKRAVTPPWGRWEPLRGRWNRNGRLGGNRRRSQ